MDTRNLLIKLVIIIKSEWQDEFIFIFQTPKWYPLLHSKYSKNKSEIRLAIYLEDDKGGEQETSFKAKDAPARRMLYMYCAHKSIFIYNMFIYSDIWTYNVNANKLNWVYPQSYLSVCMVCVIAVKERDPNTTHNMETQTPKSSHSKRPSKIIFLFILSCFFSWMVFTLFLFFNCMLLLIYIALCSSFKVDSVLLLVSSVEKGLIILLVVVVLWYYSVLF